MKFIFYWSSMSSRWLDIGLLIFYVFMDLDSVSAREHAKKCLAILTPHLINNSCIHVSENNIPVYVIESLPFAFL